jgi:hypothetical protein
MPARFALASLVCGAQVPEPPLPAAVQWTAPQECPDAEFVRAKISRRLGRGLAEGEATLVARVVRDGARGYVLQLRLSAGARAETRELADASCVALAELAVLRVVAAVEPGGAVEEAEVSGESGDAATVPEVAPEVGVESSPVPVVTADIEDVPRDMVKRTGGFVRLFGGGVVGVTPGPTGAVGLAGGLLGRRWRVELRGSFVAPRTVVRPLGALQAGLYAGAVQGCGRLGRGALEVPLCAGLEAGAMRGEARVASGRPAFAGWLAVTVTPGLVWHAGRRIGLWAGLELALAAVRPRFELVGAERTETLFRPPVASGRLWLGVEWRFADPW